MDGVIATRLAKQPARRYAVTKELARAARAALITPPRVSPQVPEIASYPPATLARTTDPALLAEKIKAIDETTGTGSGSEAPN